MRALSKSRTCTCLPAPSPTDAFGCKLQPHWPPGAGKDPAQAMEATDRQPAEAHGHEVWCAESQWVFSPHSWPPAFGQFLVLFPSPHILKGHSGASCLLVEGSLGILLGTTSLVPSDCSTGPAEGFASPHPFTPSLVAGSETSPVDSMEAICPVLLFASLPSELSWS